MSIQYAWKNGYVTPPEPPGRTVDAVDIVKVFESDGRHIPALQGVSFQVREGDRFGIMGKNGAGKSTMMKILAGVIKPSSGYIQSGMSMSWPLGLGGGFEGFLTGYDNVRFLARLYRKPFAETYEFVQSFSELTTAQMATSVRHYSNGMSARLAFALSLAIDFDCLLIDEVIAVGDQRFQQKCIDAIFRARPDRTILLTLHDPHIVRAYCTRCLVLHGGRGRVFEDIDEALAIYGAL